MILAWLAVGALSLPLLLAEGWLCVTLWPAPCVTVGLGLFLAFSARTSAVPGLLVCAALGRSVLLSGDLAVHVLALGVPVALMLPLRAVVFGQLWLTQGVAAVFVLLAVPQVQALASRVATVAVPTAPTTWPAILGVALVAPLVAAVLRRLPPWSIFAERAP